MRKVLLALSALAMTACAAQSADMAGGEREGRDCFRAEDANGFTMLDDQTVRVSVGANRGYALRLQSNARDLDYSQALAIRARGSNWICEGSGAGVDIIGGEPLTRRWPVTSITRIPDAPAGS